MRPLVPLVALLPALSYAQTLAIDVTKPVECTRKSQNGDKLSMNYKGTLTDGTKFDSSYDRGTPFKFTIGKGQVIAGWEQGLLGMCPGEGRKLTIPPNLGYGNQPNGAIPAGSTLIFETELVGIDGVKPEPVPTPQPSSTVVEEEEEEDEITSTPPPVPVNSAMASAKPTQQATAQTSPLDDDSDSGECNLLGDFALIVQGALGLLAVSSLAVKRLRESPRRPMKIWFFDVSKQVFGSVLLHLANILMSMLSSGKFDVASTMSAKNAAKAVSMDEGDQPNPCSFYLLNLAIDTTIGIPILVLLLKIFTRAALLTPLADPPESIRSGNYGHPPRATWWLKQSIIYFFGLICMKLCVLALFAFLPWIAWVGDWALRWTEGNAALQITFVMFVFPLIMNGMQYWIIDNFIKEPGHADGQYAVAAGEDSEDEETDDEWMERQRRLREAGIDADSDEEAAPVAKQIKKIRAKAKAKAARGAERDGEYDPEFDGAGSSLAANKSRRE
ncbi:FK506-binding protein-like protein 2 precursor [Dothidotthia symphoricarpi CBS 119687]|uniref:peptidylprolyl isomerase n=1 Tax=Dothidotthia symphoricarpi CBS 119687 TaxID=1392245 RepID=A0A6A6AWX8_9PLEO|nr:FK506-binding protein-like protein 2 precursor [Dothidotthia symphoricarpi CBS 119687]KAF2135041.1 FK506-binding protein-like protein 2 precursor [Dothidotthia symphoricarpi CBS 119687]